jgi:hypothetical protein
MRLVGWLIAVAGVVLLALLGWAIAPMSSTGLPPTIIGGLNTGQAMMVLAAIIGLGLGLIAATGRRRWYRS